MASSSVDPPAMLSRSAGADGLTDALVQMSFVVMAVLSRVAAEQELSLTQLRVLAILRDRRPRMSELADYLGLDKSTMSGLIDRAVKRGLIERVPNQLDGRAVDVTLTRAGTKLVEQQYRQVQDSLASSLEPLARTDQRRLEALLGQLIGPPPTAPN